MLLNEKGLVKALKSAYKRGGYTIINQEAQVVIYTAEWYVRAEWDKFPIKALATIVEHMGSLPTGEGALVIAAGYDPQTVMPEKVGDDVAGWIIEGRDTVATMVPVMVEGMQVYQAIDAAGACFAVDPLGLAIVERPVAMTKNAAVTEERRMMWRHDGEEVVLETFRPAAAYWVEESRKAVWDALEAVDLHLHREE